MTQEIKDGGTAFPHDERDADGQFRQHFGMTLRDYFAGQALAGIMARGSGTSNAVEWAPEEAYAVADAMLSARIA
jgi:hypothetical protein